MSEAVDRSELEQLDRDTLIERAVSLGVSRARVLTRAELVDELILRGPDEPVDKQRARGFFGVARDLLADVVERGLHLPDAAERIRAYRTPSPSARMRVPAALPTLTLAEIYAAQGHIARAVDTIQGVLLREPDHEAARAFLARLGDVSYPRVRLPEGDEGGPHGPMQKLGAGGTPEGNVLEAGPSDASRAGPRPVELPLEGTSSEFDECIAMAGEARTLFVYWALRVCTMEHVVGGCPGGSAVLRLVIVTPRVDGPETELRDFAIARFVGDMVIGDLPPSAVVRVAVGWKSASGEFHPAAHSPVLEAGSPDRSMWGIESIFRSMPTGRRRVDPEDRDAAAICRAIARARLGEDCACMNSLETAPPDVGTVERWIYAPEAWSVPTD